MARPFLERFAGLPAPRLVLAGYVSYVFAGWLVLCLPWSSSGDFSALDHLFTAMSAVSTTGLATLDPGTAYTPFGQAIILLLIQAGGIGYMTFSSFVVIAAANRLSDFRRKAASAAFALPSRFDVRTFIRHVIRFTLLCELAGAAALYWIFLRQDVPSPLWSAVFHSVSAFCTAGFSLFRSSFEAFRGHFWLNLVISALSLAGGIGFIVFLDVWDNLRGLRREILFTSKVILSVTFWILAAGTAYIFVAEPSIRSYPPSGRLLAAFFQVMTASTTVGFNTVPENGLSEGVLFLTIVLMAIGASPSGTGGGLKSTTVSALIGLVRSTLKGRTEISFLGRTIPPERVQIATSSLAYYMTVMGAALLMLTLSEQQPFLPLLFEAASALGTVGLSMGVTGSLTDLGKITVILLMMIGRVGFLTFGMAISTRDEEPSGSGDSELVI